MSAADRQRAEERRFLDRLDFRTSKKWDWNREACVHNRWMRAAVREPRSLLRSIMPAVEAHCRKWGLPARGIGYSDARTAGSSLGMWPIQESGRRVPARTQFYD